METRQNDKFGRINRLLKAINSIKFRPCGAGSLVVVRVSKVKAVTSQSKQRPIMYSLFSDGRFYF